MGEQVSNDVEEDSQPYPKPNRERHQAQTSTDVHHYRRQAS